MADSPRDKIFRLPTSFVPIGSFVHKKGCSCVTNQKCPYGSVCMRNTMKKSINEYNEGLLKKSIGDLFHKSLGDASKDEVEFARKRLKGVENSDPEEIRTIFGVITTPDKDSDGEMLFSFGDGTSLKPDMNWTYFDSNGVVKWEHESGADAIIGFPLYRKTVSWGTIIISGLLDNTRADETWELAQSLTIWNQKFPNQRKSIGWSIEGTYNVAPQEDGSVFGASIIAVVGTPSPKNSKTWLLPYLGEFGSLDEIAEHGGIEGIDIEPFRYFGLSDEAAHSLPTINIGDGYHSNHSGSSDTSSASSILESMFESTPIDMFADYNSTVNPLYRSLNSGKMDINMSNPNDVISLMKAMKTFKKDLPSIDRIEQILKEKKGVVAALQMDVGVSGLFANLVADSYGRGGREGLENLYIVGGYGPDGKKLYHGHGDSNDNEVEKSACSCGGEHGGCGGNCNGLNNNDGDGRVVIDINVPAKDDNKDGDNKNNIEKSNSNSHIDNFVRIEQKAKKGNDKIGVAVADVKKSLNDGWGSRMSSAGYGSAERTALKVNNAISSNGTSSTSSTINSNSDKKEKTTVHTEVRKGEHSMGKRFVRKSSDIEPDPLIEDVSEVEDGAREAKEPDLKGRRSGRNKAGRLIRRKGNDGIRRKAEITLTFDDDAAEEIIEPIVEEIGEMVSDEDFEGFEGMEEEEEAEKGMRGRGRRVIARKGKGRSKGTTFDYEEDKLEPLDSDDYDSDIYKDIDINITDLGTAVPDTGEVDANGNPIAVEPQMPIVEQKALISAIKSLIRDHDALKAGVEKSFSYRGHDMVQEKAAEIEYLKGLLAKGRKPKVKAKKPVDQKPMKKPELKSTPINVFKRSLVDGFARRIEGLIRQEAVKKAQEKAAVRRPLRRPVQKSIPAVEQFARRVEGLVKSEIERNIRKSSGSRPVRAARPVRKSVSDRLRVRKASDGTPIRRRPVMDRGVRKSRIERPVDKCVVRKSSVLNRDKARISRVERPVDSRTSVRKSLSPVRRAELLKALRNRIARRDVVKSERPVSKIRRPVEKSAVRRPITRRPVEKSERIERRPVRKSVIRDDMRIRKSRTDEVEEKKSVISDEKRAELRDKIRKSRIEKAEAAKADIERRQAESNNEFQKSLNAKDNEVMELRAKYEQSEAEKQKILDARPQFSFDSMILDDGMSKSIGLVEGGRKGFSKGFSGGNNYTEASDFVIGLVELGVNKGGIEADDAQKLFSEFRKGNFDGLKKFKK